MAHGGAPPASRTSEGSRALTDPQAIERFRALYADHHGRVYAYAVSRVGRQLADEVVSEAELSAPDVAEEVAERISVLTALAALSEADRELLTLVAWHGLKPNEAAQVVGCSTATYFVRLHRARRRLERAMADPPDPATNRAGVRRQASPGPGGWDRDRPGPLLHARKERSL